MGDQRKKRDLSSHMGRYWSVVFLVIVLVVGTGRGMSIPWPARVGAAVSTPTSAGASSRPSYQVALAVVHFPASQPDSPCACPLSGFGGQRLTLRAVIAYPTGAAGPNHGLFPGLIFAHGGIAGQRTRTTGTPVSTGIGGQSGVQSRISTVVSRLLSRVADQPVAAKVANPLKWLASQGFVVIEPFYRGSPEYPAGTPEAQYDIGGGEVDDILDTATWLRAHASTYNLDLAHIGLLGGSHGGGIAALAAERSPRAFQTLIDFFGVSSWIDVYNRAEYSRQQATQQPSLATSLPGDIQAIAEHDLLTSMGGSPQQAAAEYNRRDPDFPANVRNLPAGYPILLAHGSADTWLPLADANQFAQDIRRYAPGVHLTYVIYKGSEHGFLDQYSVARINPSISLDCAVNSWERIYEFAADNLFANPPRFSWTSSTPAPNISVRAMPSAVTLPASGGLVTDTFTITNAGSTNVSRFAILGPSSIPFTTTLSGTTDSSSVKNIIPAQSTVSAVTAIKITRPTTYHLTLEAIDANGCGQEVPLTQTFMIK